MHKGLVHVDTRIFENRVSPSFAFKKIPVHTNTVIKYSCPNKNTTDALSTTCSNQQTAAKEEDVEDEEKPLQKTSSPWTEFHTRSVFRELKHRCMWTKKTKSVRA